MACRAKERAQLEIDLRVEDMKKAYYGLAFELASSTHTILSIRRTSKAKLANTSLSEMEISHHAVYNVIRDHTEKQTNYFGFKNSFTSDTTVLSSDNDNNELLNLGQDEPPYRSTSSEAMSKDYLKFAGSDFPLEEVKKKIQSSDNEIIDKIVQSVDTLLYNITFKLWDYIDKADENAKINALLKSKREIKMTTSATEKTSQILSEIDLSNPPKELDDYIDKRHSSQVAKLRRDIKKELRKKYTGDRKNHPSTPVKSGAKSRNSSKTSTNTKQKKEKGKNKNKTQTKNKNKPASRDASNKGAKRKGNAKNNRDR